MDKSDNLAGSISGTWTSKNVETMMSIEDLEELTNNFEHPLRKLGNLWGIEVFLDENLPPDTWEIRVGKNLYEELKRNTETKGSISTVNH